MLTRILCVAALLVATAFITPATAQNLRQVNEGSSDASNIWAETPVIVEPPGLYNADGFSGLAIAGLLEKPVGGLGEADGFALTTSFATRAIWGWFGDSDLAPSGNNRVITTFTYQFASDGCQESWPTPGSPRSVVYDFVPDGNNTVGVGVGTFETRCGYNPDRMQPYHDVIDPTYGYELITLEPRPTPHSVELVYDAEPLCNSDLAEITLDQDLVWFRYHDPVLNDGDPDDRRRSGFALDVSNVDLDSLGFKIYTNTISMAAITDEQGNLLYHQYRDCSDPAIPQDSFCGNGPAMPIGYLAGFTGDRIYIWFGILRAEEDPREPGNPTCMTVRSSAWAVREAFAGLLLFYGDAELGAPVVNMTGDGGREAVVSVPVHLAQQLGAVEIQLIAGTTVVRTDTVRAWDNVSVADRWRTNEDFVLTTSFANLPDGAYTVRATPLVAGLYSNVGHRRDDLAVSTTVQVVSREGEVPTSPTLSLRAYPNPSRGDGTIHLTLPSAGDVTVEVYDVLGRRVATLVDARLTAGDHRLPLPTGLAPGTYVARALLDDGSVTATRLTVLR